MYEIKENRRELFDGTEITTYTRDVVSANILQVEAGTTGYKGGDTGHGRRTYFRISDEASTDITKSISRFARNTLDCLQYIRQLKDKNIPVYFEKEAINTLDAKGEVLITIMASLAQQESQSMSQNIKAREGAGQSQSIPRIHQG